MAQDRLKGKALGLLVLKAESLDPLCRGKGNKSVQSFSVSGVTPSINSGSHPLWSLRDLKVFSAYETETASGVWTTMALIKKGGL